jgi:hypothetical protein
MRPPPKADSPQEPTKPSKALGNVFAVPAATEDKPDELKAGPPLPKSDDGTVEVKESASGTIELDVLDQDAEDQDAEALAAAASASIPAPVAEAPAPVLRDSQGKPYDGSITGVAFDMFPTSVEDGAKSDPGSSSATQQMNEVERRDLFREFGKMGITFRSDSTKLSNDTLKKFLDLLRNARWPWADNHIKLKQKLIIIYTLAFPDEITRILPNYDTSSVGPLAEALVTILRGRGQKHIANKIKQSMPKFPNADPPPLPPDSKK